MSAPILTPAGPLARDGKSLTALSADQAVTWTTNGGTLSSVTSTTATWTAPNETGTWTITATNGSAQATNVLVAVRAVIPNYWIWKTAIHAKKPILIFRPIFGPSQSRGFGDNSAVHDWELVNDDCSYEHFIEMRSFWDYHYPGKQFDLIDPVLNERRTYEADSDLDFSYNHADSFTWGARIKEAYPYALVA